MGEAMETLKRMYEEHIRVLDYLSTQRQISHHTILQATLPKVLLLAAASEFEERVCDSLRAYVRGHTSDPKILELVNNKAIERQYHTLFDWKARNANTFWKLFGAEFGEEMKKYCRENRELSGAIDAFLEIGRSRNEVVHNNYATYSFEKTIDDVYRLYGEANKFVDSLPGLLKNSTISLDGDGAS
ncbi:hypothetical protein SAMN05216215_103373 [Saccharopolyspora shandongensis]|uniref:RiboL-PSP-HEPN domain-containing protein n=1 Tax=Saccharopolyspora shandongensis TaxID=418495 RepID=A0A1H3M640_9PSEU|nr:HEPN domain-containing protein [Saccharopolyspora shandongensis]SDY72180.1 hypothetical protein SAMN05216215_103373 [Saccharopolyspora shandongensis]